MGQFGTEFLQAFHLIISGDPTLWAIIFLSLRVSLISVALACVLGFPLGAFLGLSRFRGRSLLNLLLNVFMGLPPVVVGLLVYLALSTAGPLGALGLLFTPWAMIVAQTLLVLPIVAALSRQVLEDLSIEYRDLFASLGIGMWQRFHALMWEGRVALFTVMIAGFGRAIAEVGAVMIVGGNIAGETRVMTTAIALETSKGNLELALALGCVLLVLALAVNAFVTVVKHAIHRERDVALV